MKTAIWLYLFMFVAIFDLHAQYPILSPFALSIGAAPSFIGLIMGVYSLTHLPGNLLAGIGVDRFGSKLFIICSLVAAGIVLLFQSAVTDPWQLLAIRSISGFVLAFLSPACMALLAKLAKDRIQQGHLMSGNGLVHTLASVVSPAAGALLVAKLGFQTSFTLLGIVLISTGIMAAFAVREPKQPPSFATVLPGSGASSQSSHTDGATRLPSVHPDSAQTLPWLFFAMPLAIACSQGILFFELPLAQVSKSSIFTSGLLFSAVSLGALLTLGMVFLNRVSPFLRTVAGSFALAIVFFGMSIDWPFPFFFSLFMIGMAKGIIFPAMSTLLAGLSDSSRYGRAFSIMSISSSVGAFLGPIAAGQLRDQISPYFLAFLGLMAAVTMLPLLRMREAEPPGNHIM